ncbi:MAG: RHS repeat-associated core domain-containing protein, partial [Bacteroidota bacterium]
TSTSWASPSNVHATDYSYDQNGNITQLQRRDAAGNLLDDITYTYETDENGNKINRLKEVNDPTVTADPSDIEGKHGFTYDQQGNLSRDEKEKTNIDWNNQNKVHQVRQEEADKAHITFRYDATGNRIEKEVNRNGLLPDGSRSYADPTKVTTTYYVRDAQGNVMSIYEKRHEAQDGGGYLTILTQQETYLYGSDRLGVDRQEKIVGTVSSATATEAIAAEITAPETLNLNSDTPPSSNGLLPNGNEVIATPTSKDQYEDRSYWVLSDATNTPGGSLDLTEGFNADLSNAEGFFAEIAEWEDIKTEEEVYAQRVIGKKQYELKDRLSNVKVVLSDQKKITNLDEVAGTYEQQAKVLAYESYYPYGKPLGGRMSYTLDFTPRHSFNGKEDNPEWNSSIQDYGMRMYDRDKTIFYTIDPLASSYPMLSPYHFAHRNPIMNVDLDGLEGYSFHYFWNFYARTTDLFDKKIPALGDRSMREFEHQTTPQQRVEVAQRLPLHVAGAYAEPLLAATGAGEIAAEVALQQVLIKGRGFFGRALVGIGGFLGKNWRGIKGIFKGRRGTSTSQVADNNIKEAFFFR